MINPATIVKAATQTISLLTGLDAAVAKLSGVRECHNATKQEATIDQVEQELQIVLDRIFQIKDKDNYQKDKADFNRMNNVIENIKLSINGLQNIGGKDGKGT